MTAVVSGEETSTQKVTLTQTTKDWQNSFDFPKNLTFDSSAAGPTGTAGQEITITATKDGATSSIKLSK